jgi:hypothetical protein
MRFLLGFLSLLLLVGCGYKPVSSYAKKSFSEKIYVNIVTSPSEPENTVKVRDQVRMALMTKFGSSLTDDKNSSNTRLDVSIIQMSSDALQINNQGYVIVYRMIVKLNTNIYFADINKTKNIISTGSQDFPVDPKVGISSSAQTEAIGSAASKAVDSLISQLAIIGVKR